MSTTHQLSHRSGEFGYGLGRTTTNLLRAGAAALAGWLRHRRERDLLAGLDDGMLRDVGLTSSDVAREYDRPFWQPVDYAALDAARRRSGPRLRAGVSKSATVVR